jgi:predicted ATP-grasp superfamily ATP-dependent carboligase
VRVLVLDGNENQAVACVRSLAGAGHRVSVGADSSWSKAGWSRSCSDHFCYPSPQTDAAAFIESIAAEAAREPCTLVLPMTERTTLPLSTDRERVYAAGGRMVLPDHETLLRAFDKGHTTKLAESLGLVVPLTATISSEADVRECVHRLRFPVIVKPCSSEEYVAGGQARTTGAPLYARNENELLRAWNRISRRCRAALVQEFTDGDGVGYFALMRNGEPRAEFAHRRLRDVRPTGSGSALRVSVSADGLVREQGLAVLRALKWHGVAMVEFRLRPDGTPVFLEVNGRFWTSLALAVHAGADFPALLAELAERGDVAPPGPYRVGVRCRWLLGDARHLAEVWRGAPAEFPGVFPGRWATLAAVLTPVAGTYHDNFTVDDPLPELGDWIDFVGRRVPRRARVGRHGEAWHAAGRPSHP